MDDFQDMTTAELASRVLFTLLEASARLGLKLGATQKQLAESLDMAIFKAARQRGLKLDEVASLLEVSMRKASRLSKRLKQNFLQQDAEVTLPRRIEFALWSSPLGERRLAQALPDASLAQVREALHELVAEGRVVAKDGRTTTYAVTHKDSRLVRDTWMARLDGLGVLAKNVTDAVTARFFSTDPRAFARTISFRLRKQDIALLQQLYEEHIWPTISALDGAAEDDDDADVMALSIVWAPDGEPSPD